MPDVLSSGIIVADHLCTPIDNLSAVGGLVMADQIISDAPLDECLRPGSALGESCVREAGTTPGVFTRQDCEPFLIANKFPIERLC